MANLETLQVTVDAKIDAYKKKMNWVKNITSSTMQKVDSELGRTKGPDIDISVDKSLEEVSKAVETVKKKLQEINDVKINGRGVIAKIHEESEQTTTKLNKVQESVNAAKTSIKEVVKAHPSLAKLQEVLSAVVTAGKKGFGMLATAVDKTRGAITKVSGVAQSLVQKFRSMASAIGGAVSRLLSFGKSADKVSNKTNLLSGVVGKLAGVFAAVSFVQFGKSCLELGSDLAEVQNVVDVTFRDMSKSIDKWSKDAAAKFGLSETMAKKYAGTFGAMAKSFGFSEQEAYKMSTTLTGLSGDVASFYNLNQDEAYNKIKSIFTGETESLKELGVVMTQNALDQFAMANGFGKTTQAMTEQEKVALRYAFVQDKLNGAAGDFSRTADGWANQVRVLNLQFESLKATIGQGLINAFTPIIKVVNTILGKVATLANAFKALTELIFGNGGSSSGGSITDSTGDIASGYDNATDSANNLADATEKAGNAAEDAAKKALGLLSFDKINKIADNSSSTSGSSGSGSGGSGSGGAITGGSVDFGTLTEAEESTNSLGAKLAAVLDVFSKAWDEKGARVITAWRTGFTNIKTLVGDIGDSIYEVFTNGTGLKFIESALEVFADIGDIVSTIAKAIDTAWNTNGNGTKFLESCVSKWTAILTLVDNIVDSAVSVFGNGTGSSIIGNGLNILTNINTTVTNLATNFTKAWNSGGAGTAVMQSLFDIIDSILSTANDVTSSFAEWSKDVNFSPLIKAIGAVLDAVNKLVGVVGDKFKNFVDTVWLPFASATIEKTIPDTLTKIAEAISSFADGDYSGAGEAIGSIIGGLNKSLKDFTGSEELNAAANSFAKNIANTLNGFLKTVNLGDLGTSLSNALRLAINSVTTFAKEFDWKTLGSQIGEFIAGLNWGSILYDSAKLIFTAIFAIGKFAAGVLSGWAGGVAKNLKATLKNSTALKGVSDAISGAIKSVKITIKGVKDKTFNAAKNAWDSVKKTTVVKTIKAKLNEAWEKAYSYWTAIKSGTKDCIKNVWAKVKGKWDAAKKRWESIETGIYDAIWNVKASIQGKWEAAKKNWKAIKAGAFDCVKTIKAVKDSGWDKAKKLWDGLYTKTVEITLKFSESVSSIARWLNTNLIGPLESKLRSIPAIGRFVTLPRLPAYADGAWIGANNPHLAMVGDNRNHPEIVAPEPKLEKMATEAAENAGAKIDYNMLEKLVESAVYAATMAANQQSDNNTLVTLEGDAEKLFRLFVNKTKDYYRVHGSLPFPV